MTRVWVTFGLLLIAGGAVAQTTRPAANCTYAEVSARVSDAVDGDTVTVPACAVGVTWTTTLTITNKSISIIGAGIGSTVIISGAGTTNGKLIDWTTKATGGSPAGFSRLSGFTFDQGVSCTGGDQSAVLHIQGFSKNVRFDHNRVVMDQSCGGMRIDDAVAGVIDNSEFVISGYAHALQIQHRAWEGVGAYGDQSWATPSTWGTADVMAVEDVTFTSANGDFSPCYAVNDNAGSRTAYRYNNFGKCNWSSHGTETGQRWRGFRHTEVIHNTFTNLGMNSVAIGFRGGTGFVFDNTVAGTVTDVASVNTYRRNDPWDAPSGHTGTVFWGRCGRQTITSLTCSGTTATAVVASNYASASGSNYTISGATQAAYNGNVIAYGSDATHFTYTISSCPGTATGSPVAVSRWDGNSDATGYRCLDQGGAGYGTYISGDTHGTIGPIGSLNQQLEPIYAWNNTNNGTLRPMVGQADVIVDNRDLYNQTTSFTGATGIGRGLLTARPITCTTGVAYWAADQGEWDSTHAGADGQLYVCSATNTWTLYYTPYPYPHPLTTGAPPVPNPPSNFRVQD